MFLQHFVFFFFPVAFSVDKVSLDTDASCGS